MNMRILAGATATAVCALLLASGPVDAATTASAGVHLASYSNCTQLNKVYKHGISDKQKPKKWWIKRGATAKGAYKPGIYANVHRSLDRDGDHIACEK